MPEKQSNKDRLKEITDGIEQGIRELFESDKYRRYFSVLSRFHRYSVNNTMLIYLQNPEATLVAGFNKWRDTFGRHVRKGEKGIQIIAPTPYKKKIEQIQFDPDTKLPILDDDGNPVKVEKEIKVPMFKVVSVYDVSQTYGKPLPQLASSLSGDVRQYEEFLEALLRSSTVPISFQPLEPSTDGYFSPKEQSITIREGMSQIQTVSAIIHEMAHSRLHNHMLPVPENAEALQEIEVFGVPGLFSNGRIATEDVPEGMFCYELRGSDDDPGLPISVEHRVVVNHAGTVITSKPLPIPESGWLAITEDEGINFVGGNLSIPEFVNRQRKDRRTEEVEAESVSYAVCQYYGIETGENSFGYIATWSKGKELKELRSSLETINKTASGLISDIDRNFAEICKERGIEPKAICAPENELPDPFVTIQHMERFGYHGNDMLPLSRDRALELSAQDVTVYLLYPDGSEAMAFEEADITTHVGLYGISKEDWAQTCSDTPARDVEKRFLENPQDSFAIYQMNDTAPVSELFTPYEQLAAPPQRSYYDAIFTGAMHPADSPDAMLEKLYTQFNVEHPADFAGHSLSVSDIIALKQDGAVSYYYCDSAGFRELPDFQKPENYLKAAEMSMEDDYGMIDGIINNGPKNPEPEDQQKKPSILEQLRNPPPQKPKSKSAPKRSEEREL